MQALNHLLQALRLEANVFHNGQYCGMWAIDTSGTGQMAFHVVSKGRCFLQIEDEQMELSTGDFLLLPNDIPHMLGSSLDNTEAINTQNSVTIDDSTDGTGLVCGYFCNHNPIFQKLAKQLPNYIIVRQGDGTASSQLIELILQESRSSGQSTSLLLNRLSDCLLYILLRDNLSVKAGVFSAVSHPKLGRAMDMIHSKQEIKPSVEELAIAAGMSRSAFSALFKEIVGQSPADYQTQWLMTNAWLWLAEESISTFEAALRSGYETEASFAKAFKRVHGVGPGQARQHGKAT